MEYIYFKVAVGDTDATKKNREIRKWLSAKCDCTWETQISNDYKSIEVYFDPDAEKDAVTFKMFCMELIDDWN